MALSGLAAAAFLLAAVLLQPAPAHATEYPETWLPDSKGHAFCLTDSMNTKEKRDIAYWAMDRVGDTTDLDTFVEPCAAGTDVWWAAKDLGGTLRGWAECVTWNSDRGVCDSADVILDLGRLNRGNDDWYDHRKTAVHEVGHTVGLDHHSPGAHDCAMIRGEIPGRDMKWRSFHAHDIAHINDQF